MEVSIIIPTRDRNTILIETLNSIKKADLPKNDFEVIVVNDGEENIVIPDAILNEIAITVIESNLKGAAFARNMGAKIAKGDFFLFLDDDILIQKDNITRHLAIHTTFPGSLVSGVWKYSPEVMDILKQSSFGKFKVKYDYKSQDGSNGVEVGPNVIKMNKLSSFNLSMSKTVFFDLGGFNEAFLYAGCEDQEFTGKALNKGCNLLLDKNNLSFHNEKDRVSLDKWLFRQYSGIQGFVILAELFPQRKDTSLYYENTPVFYNDPLRIKIKKTIKFFLAKKGITRMIEQFVKVGEAWRIPDQLLFKMYNILAGIYLYKGFAHAYGARSKNCANNMRNTIK